MKQPGYVLTIFAGNTHVIFGVYAGGRYVGRWRIESRANRSADQYGTWLFNTFEYVDIDPTLVEGVVMACTSAMSKKILTKMCERYFDITPLVVGSGIKTGVSINYGRAGDLSANRVANIVGLGQEYQLPAMVVDCDSVTSFDILDGEGKYIGGTVAPGIMTSLNMLPQVAPQLPEVPFDYTEKVVGRNIQESLQAGHFWSAVDMIDATVQRIWNSLGIQDGTVVGTGAYIHEIEGACASFHAIDSHLLFNGLKEIYNLNATSQKKEDWEEIELPRKTG
jgi:type III pantothenate kinase